LSEISAGKYGATLTLDDSEFVEGMENAEKKMDSFTGSVDKNTSDAGKKMSGFGAGLGTIAAGAVAGLGIALVGAGVAGVGMADDLQKSLNNLQASTGVTDEEIKGMEESLKNIYNANLGESFDDIATSMASVKQNTGLTGKALEDATKNALLLRDTFEMDVTETTNTANSLMKQFGITSEEAFNLIAQGAQNGANKNGDLLDSLNEYAPQFKSMGFNAEQFTNVLIDGAQNGAFSIDKVGDAVKEFNIRAKDGSKTSAEGFKLLGLNADDMTDAFAKGGDTAQEAFSQVMTSLNSIEDPVKKNAAGVALFGAQFEDLEANGVAALANIGNTASLSKDTLGQINEIKYDSFGEAIQGIGRNLQTGLLLPLGEMVLPMLNTFANWINERMPLLQEIFSSVFSTINSLATDVYNFYKENLMPTFSDFGSSVSTLFPTIKSIFETVFDAIVKVAKIVWNFYKTNLLPIFLSFYDWISGNMPTIKSTIQNAFDAVVKVASKVWDFFQSNLLPILSSLFESIQSKMPKIQSITETAFSLIKNVVETAWDVFENMLLPILKTLWDWIKPHLPKIGSIVEGAFDVIIAVVETTIGVFEDVTNAIKTAIDWLTFWDNKEPKKKTLTVEEKRTGVGGNVPQYAVGTPFVPNDQLALIHKGEAIIPAKYNPFNKSNNMQSLGGSSPVLNTELHIHMPLQNAVTEETARKIAQVAVQEFKGHVIGNLKGRGVIF